MKILVLSDLHVGVKSRAKDLCPYPESRYKDDKLTDSFIESVKNYQKDNGNIDYLIIPGDITHQSNLIEYDYGSKFISRLLREIGLEKEKVIYVPGNHDVDWSVLKGDTIYPEEIEYRTKHKYNTLKDENHIFSKISTPELINEPFVKRWDFDDIAFVGYNSSWHDDSFNEKHYGLIEQSQLTALADKIKGIDEKKIKIFVVHHHLHQFENPHPSWIDISIMQNAHPLLQLLLEYDFDFIIHGHKHVPFFLNTTISGSNHINILCAGSYSCEIPTEIAGNIGNLYHIVDFKSLEDCKGKVYSYVYNSTEGWIESDKHYGIEFENPFGCKFNLNDMKTKMEQVVNEMLKIGNIIVYNDIVKQIPDLEYFHNVNKEKLISHIVGKFNLKFANSKSDSFFIKL